MVKQLSGLDSVFLYLEKSRFPMEVSSLQIYDPSTAPGGEVRFKEILATIDSRLNRSKVFKRKLQEVPFSLDHPYWIEDPDFDIEYHVRHIALPKPGDWQQLMNQVSRLQSQHLDKTRPLWEVYVIEGLNNIEGVPKGCFAMFMKMHHASIDGFSGQEIQVAIHDLEPVKMDMSKYVASERQEGKEPPGNWDLLFRSPMNNMKKTANLLMGVAGAVPGVIKAGWGKRGKPANKVPKTVFNVGRVSPNRVVDARIFDLDGVKKISRTVEHTTVNDVVLAVISGAMRKYLKTRGHLPSEPLVTFVPINTRSKDGAHDDHDNMLSFMTVSLCSDVADPIDRLHAIHESTKDAKAYTETVGAGTATSITMNMPSAIAKTILPTTMEILSRAGVTPANTLITNVPGIQQPIYLAGAEMVSMIGILPVADLMGLLHAVFSYNGKLSIAFTACRDMMTDPVFYADCIEEAYNDLWHAVFPVTRPGRKRKTAKKKTTKKATARKTRAKKTSARKKTSSKTPVKKTGKKKKVSRKKAAVKGSRANK